MNLIEQTFEKAIRLQNESQAKREKEKRKTKGWLERRIKRVVEFTKKHKGQVGITMENGETILYENGKRIK